MSNKDEIDTNASELSSGEEVPTPSDPTDNETVCSCDSSSIRNGDRRHEDGSKEGDTCFRIPIVGYEVMEERAKFTVSTFSHLINQQFGGFKRKVKIFPKEQVFKLRIEKESDNDCWFVFRRYTDFVRLHSKLKADHPEIELPLPKKKWFGDNFNSNFLDERIVRLQDLINAVTQHKVLIDDPSVRDFFCLDEPPSITDNVEESKAVVEALEERIFHLQRQLKEKETAYERLKAAHSVEISAKLRLAGFIQECTRECSSCTARLSQMGQVTQ